MNRTQIEWIVNPDGSRPGWSWNPLTGCLNNCSYCYARKLANGRLRSRYLANQNTCPVPLEKSTEMLDGILALKSKPPCLDPFYPRFWEDRFVEADKFLKSAKKSLGIFPCDMSDWCGIGIPYEWSNMLYSLMVMHKRHRFYLLTKQPQNLIKFSPFPDNCWVGVTATNAEYFATACFYLKDVEAQVKYLSIEPYLGMIIGSEMDILLMKMAGISQVIIGAQTKPYKPPEISWVEEIVRACDKASVPVFLKDNLKPLFASSVEEHGYNQLFFRRDQLRQELPSGK